MLYVNQRPPKIAQIRWGFNRGGGCELGVGNHPAKGRDVKRR